MIPFYVEKKCSGKDRLAVSLPVMSSCYFYRLENKLQVLHCSREGADYLTFHTLDSLGMLPSSTQLTNQEYQTNALCYICIRQRSPRQMRKTNSANRLSL